MIDYSIRATNNWGNKTYLTVSNNSYQEWPLIIKIGSCGVNSIHLLYKWWCTNTDGYIQVRLLLVSVKHMNIWDVAGSASIACLWVGFSLQTRLRILNLLLCIVFQSQRLLYCDATHGEIHKKRSSTFSIAKTMASGVTVSIS